MSRLANRFAFRMALAIAGAGGMAGPASAAETLACDIRVTSSGDMVDLEAVLTAEKAVSGTYEFAVKSSSSGGNSDISQGDTFSARAGETTLGTVSINGSYTAKLTVTSGGTSIACEKKG